MAKHVLGYKRDFAFCCCCFSVTQSCLILCNPMDPMESACQTSLSFTIFLSLLKLISIWLVMPSDHLIHCCPLLLLPSIFPNIRVFLMSWLFTLVGQSIGALASESVLPMNIQDLFFLELTSLISLQSKGLSEYSPTQFESINSSVLSILYGPACTSEHDHWKNHSFDFTDLCWQSNVSAF